MKLQPTKILHTAIFFGASLMVTSCANKPVKILGDAYLTKYDESAKLEHSTLIALDTTAADLPVININPEKKYQSMDGFGYTLTGGSAMLLHKMSKAARAKILQELFGTEKNDLGIKGI